MPKTNAAPESEATVAINVNLPLSLHRQLKITAATRDLTLKTAVQLAIEEWVDPPK